MTRKHLRLNDRTVKAARDGVHLDGDGLLLQVRGEQRSWIFRYAVTGKVRWMGLGSARVLGLAEARQKAQDARRLILAGIDPLQHKRDQECPSSPRAVFSMIPVFALR